MTTRIGSTHAGSSADPGATPPYSFLDPGKVGAKIRKIREIFDLSTATFASGDLLYLGRLPTGSYFSSVALTSSVSLSTSTVSVGSAASAAKYKAAAVFTAVDTPTSYCLTSAKQQAALTAPEDVYLTIATANLPAAGILVVEIDYLATA